MYISEFELKKGEIKRIKKIFFIQIHSTYLFNNYSHLIKYNEAILRY